MRTDNERHVVFRADGEGWNVEKPEAKKPSAHTASQAEAKQRAREIVEKAGGGTIFVHGKDGAVKSKIRVVRADAKVGAGK